MAEADPRWSDGGGDPYRLTPDDCKRARMLARWSIADLAGRSGVHPVIVARFEAGEGEHEIAGRLLAAFNRHGIEHHEGRWLCDGDPFNGSDDLRPHDGQAYLSSLPATQSWPGRDDLTWPRSADMPDHLFERPVPTPWWAESPQIITYEDGRRVVTQLPPAGPPSRLSEIEREWLKRNPHALAWPNRMGW